MVSVSEPISVTECCRTYVVPLHCSGLLLPATPVALGVCGGGAAVDTASPPSVRPAAAITATVSRETPEFARRCIKSPS